MITQKPNYFSSGDVNFLREDEKAWPIYYVSHFGSPKPKPLIHELIDQLSLPAYAVL